MTQRTSLALHAAIAFGGIVASTAILLSQAPRGPAPTQRVDGQARLAVAEAGTYQLQVLTNEGTSELYRINTKTGQVWRHAEHEIVDAESLPGGAGVPGANRLFAEASRQGKKLYSAAYWKATSETTPDLFFMR
jgi:hypothetical protein